MKTVCIYHSIDLDGFMSAAIVKHWWQRENLEQLVAIAQKRESTTNNSIEFVGYNYGQPIPDLSEYDKVIMIDVSFPKEEMKKIYFDRRDNKTGKSNFIWIDHHISAIEDNTEINTKKVEYKGLQDTNFAACELTWKYFFPNESMPEIVRLLGLYDSFRHKGTNEETKVLEFQYGARQVITNYKEAYNVLNMPSEHQDTFEYMTLESGKAIYQYLCTEAKQSYKNGFKIELKEPWGTEGAYIRKFICINKERFNPINFGIDYHADGYDGCACFHYANDMWNFSLYNENGEVDCSVIAKQYGGGGHAGASRMRLNNTQFLQLING